MSFLGEKMTNPTGRRARRLEPSSPGPDARTRLLVVGPVPPPHAGVAELTRILLGSSWLHDHFEVLHLDTSDPRPLSNVGNIDWENVRLALLHGVRFVGLLVAKRPRVVYLPIAENVPAFLRDLLFLLPSHLLRRRVVIHCHGAGFRRFFDRAPTPVKWLIRLALRPAQRVIVVGDSLRALFEGLVPPDRVVAALYGVPDMSRDDDGDPVESRSPVTVTFLSNMSTQKGAFTFLDAAREVLASRPGVCFKLAGEWFRRDEHARALEIARQMDSHVELLGPVGPSAKSRLLKSSDIFVFPGLGPEGSPLVILEAMSAGLPVVVTRVGAIAEVVADGVTGFLTEPGDARAIAERIVRLVDDESLRRRMGEAGRRLYLANFTTDHWAQRVCSVLVGAAEPI